MSDTNDTIARINQLEGEIRQLQTAAEQHEAQARTARAAREERRLEVSRLRSIVNDARVAHQVDHAVSVIDAAKSRIEQLSSDFETKLKELSAAVDKAKAPSPDIMPSV